MRPLLKPLLAVAVGFLSTIFSLHGQTGFNTGLNGAVIDLPCNENCINVPVRIPHLKSTEDYTVSHIDYAPYAYVTPTGSEDSDIYDDDMYSNFISLPFPFCFYDSVYTKVVVGSNGLITFDETNGTGTCANAYEATFSIPTAATNVQCQQFSAYYPRAAIFGIYTDLDPTSGASPSDRKIEWRVEGTAPFRRFVVSYYKVGSFGQATTCGLSQPSSFQIVIYETTGIVEIHVGNYTCHATIVD